MSYVLDSEFLIALAEGNTAATRLLLDLKKTGQPFIIPTPVVYEIEVGLVGIGDQAARDTFDSITRGHAIKDFDLERARRAGRIQAALNAAGKRGGDVDVMVTSFAMPRRDEVVSNDTRFPDIAQAGGVTLRTYWPANACEERQGLREGKRPRRVLAITRTWERRPPRNGFSNFRICSHLRKVWLSKERSWVGVKSSGVSPESAAARGCSSMTGTRRPRKKELDADGLLEIARAIGPEAGKQLEEFFEARSKRQIELQKRRPRSGA